MDAIKINKWIKEAHDNAVERGFYDCSKCKGKKTISKPAQGFYPPTEVVCPTCNGTGIHPNKNIGELLMLIVSELGEALEAHKCGKTEVPIKQITHLQNNAFHPDDYTKWLSLMTKYKSYFPFKIADVFIRLFDLCGYLGLTLSLPEHNIWKSFNNMGEQIFYLCNCVHRYDEYYQVRWAGEFYTVMLSFSSKYNIPLEKHIEAKLSYNRTQEKI